MAKPVIKWAGGKGQLLSQIKYPDGLGQDIDKYAEPFVGGGAVLFDILNKYDLKEVYISDINRELINMYIRIRDNVYELARLLSIYQDEYSKENYYYIKRDRYNELIKNNLTDTVEAAALFIFLNKTCFNGLYRVNKDGLFNVPSGKYKNPKICDKDNLYEVSKALSKVAIVHGDYTLSEAFIDKHTFAYFDPPYRPLTKTGFTSYTKNGFSDKEQEELAEFIQTLIGKGAKVTVSNSDPKNTDENDNFFDSLYQRQNIRRIYASRAINSNGTGRGKISELLIANF